MPALNFSNFSANFSALHAPASQCMVNGQIDMTCFNKNICGQIANHYQTAGIALLAAFLVVDVLIPLFFAYVIPRLKLGPQLVIMRLPGWQATAISWLKARLLWGFVIYTLYRLVI